MGVSGRGHRGARTTLVTRRVAALALAVGAPVLGWWGAAGAVTTGLVPGTVFVTNLNLDTVTMISPTTDQRTTIHGTQHRLNGPLGIAIAPDGHTAYVTNSLGSTVTPLNLTVSPVTFEAPVKVGAAPAAIAIAPDGRTAYVTNFNDNTVTPIRLTTSPPTPLAPITVGAGPWSLALSPDGSILVVSDSESSSVSVVTVATRAVATVDVGARPQAIVVSPDGHTAYVAAGNGVTPINLAASPAVAESPVPVANGPVGVVITPDGHTAFTANNDNTITRIVLTTNPPIAGTPVAVGALSQPDGMAVTPDGKRAYIANASNSVTPIDLGTNPVTALSPIPVGSATFGIAIAPDQAPIARLQVIPGTSGHATTFDASQSTSPDGGILFYTWNFGDGQKIVTTLPVTHHVYTHSGTYHATVRVTSKYGTSVASTFTGQTMSNHGSSLAQAERVVTVSGTLRTTPPSGPPGVAVHLRDASLSSTCATLYVFFDDHMIAQATPTEQVLDIPRLVIPGNATIGQHTLRLSCSLTGARFAPANFQVVTITSHLTLFSTSMPSTGELGHHLASAGGIGLGMLLISRLISAGFPSEWLDSTYEANRERFQHRFRKRFPWMFRDRTKVRSKRRELVGGTGIFLGFIATAGLINSFLDPGFGLNRSALWFFIGQSLGVGIITLTSQLPVALGGLREHRDIHLQVLIGGMIIAIVCVATSRAIGLSPGYCYGLIAVFVLNPKVKEHEWGKLHGIASIAVLVVATAAFFLRIPVYHAATSSHPSPWALILVPALDIAFIGGFASLAFGMFPLPFLPGRHMSSWNKPAWLVISFLGLLGFIAVLLSPGSGSPSELKHVGLVPMIVAFAAFAVFSLVVMVYFHYHPFHHPDHESEGAPGASTLEVGHPETPSGGPTLAPEGG